MIIKLVFKAFFSTIIIGYGHVINYQIVLLIGIYML